MGGAVAIKFNGHNSSGLAGNTGGGGGGGGMSRMQLHSERLNATPFSSLFVPKSSTTVELHHACSVGGAERDRLLALRRSFLAEFLKRTHSSQQPITIWSLPRELRDADRLQALYGVTHTARDAVLLAQGRLQLIGGGGG